MSKRNLVRRVVVALGATAAMAGIVFAPAIQRWSAPVNSNQAMNHMSVTPSLSHI